MGGAQRVREPLGVRGAAVEGEAAEVVRVGQQAGVLGVQRGAVEAAAGDDPADDAVGADRAVPRARLGAGQADVEPQAVAGALAADDRAERVEVLVGQQRGEVAELADRPMPGQCLISARGASVAPGQICRR